MLKVVYDCNVYLQALASPDGPAGQCVELAFSGRVTLFISPMVLDEIREVTTRPRLISKFKLREERVESLLNNLRNAAVVIPSVPEVWTYERDPDDAHYINLALSAGARLVVSRDKDLLDLMKSNTQESRSLFESHPDFQIVTPPGFLAIIREISD